MFYLFPLISIDDLVEIQNPQTNTESKAIKMEKQ